MSSSLPRSLTVVAVVAMLSSLVTMGACSNSEAPKVSSVEAASTIAAVYGLSDDEESCLEQAFRDEPKASRPLATDQTSSEADRNALADVADRCIPVATLAEAITAGASDGFPSMTGQQRTCLTDSVTTLSDDDRRTLLVGLAVNRSLDEIALAEMGKVTNGILGGCGISIADPGDATVTAPPPTAG